MAFWLFSTKMVSRDQCLANQNVLQTKCSQPKWCHVISVLQTAEPQKRCHVTRIFEPRTKSNGLCGRPEKSTCPRTSEMGSKCCSNKAKTQWTEKICLALPKFSTNFIFAKFSSCQAWVQWDTAKYLFTISVNHSEINTIACTLFARKVI